MHLTVRNVNDAFDQLVYFMAGDDPRVARRPYANPNGSGHTRTLTEPLLLTYTHPRERVLFNAARDANPFFHLYEALWMLAGRNDVAPLAYYNSRIAGFSDDGETFNGAYGYRWRHARNVVNDSDFPRHDQLVLIVEHLRADPSSRRAVLNMWNVQDDLLKIDRSKDVCCNLNVMFSLRPINHPDLGTVDSVLDMTVTNRSNDLVWGMLGANAVHFSILQEYVAARLGVGVGYYHHFTNNLHVYEDRPDWQPTAFLRDDPHLGGRNPVPLVRDPKVFDEELPQFVERHARDAMGRDWQEPWLRTVAQPMCIAWHHSKRGDLGRAQEAARVITDDGWRIAATEWLGRRASRRAGTMTLTTNGG